MNLRKLHTTSFFSNLFRVFTLRNILMLMVVSSIAVSSPSCKIFEKRKEKKRLEQERVEAQKRLREQIEKTNNELDEILSNENLTLDEKKKLLNDIKSRNLNDSEINKKIAQLQAEIDEEENKKIEKEKVVLTAKQQMLNAFSDIANASSVSKANSIIDNALKLCANENIPVLIVIAEENGVKDYDKPTNIKKYLEYIKDQKRFVDKVENIVLDDNGKIRRIELRK